MREKLVKSVLNRKKKRDDWFLDDYTLNPYEGCSINCQYCYVRGSKYGLNMEETLTAKVNSVGILDKELGLRSRRNQHGIIALASATDPYLRAEESYRLTRGFLELILKYRFPVMIITKSDLILRDLDILKEIDRAAIHAPDLAPHFSRGAIVSFSFSTMDQAIASRLEPGAITPDRRLEVLSMCKDEGLFTGANLMPVLPFINDDPAQLDAMISRLAQAGADYVVGGGLTLFGNGPADSKTLYTRFLERRFPQLLTKYNQLYGSYFFPPHHYQRRLTDNIRTICAKHQIASSISEAARSR